MCKTVSRGDLVAVVWLGFFEGFVGFTSIWVGTDRGWARFKEFPQDGIGVPLGVPFVLLYLLQLSNSPEV